MPDPIANVVVVLPGLCGSSLLSNGESIWPGDPLDYFDYPERKLQRLIDDQLSVGDIIRMVNGIPVYQPLIDFLSSHGYRERTASGPPNLYVFAYDWRQDLVATAGKLADRIVDICDAYRGACSIQLLAHSTGGLIARCLLESGEFDDRLGQARAAIRDLMLIGTGGKGIPYALGGIVGLEGLVFLKPDQAKRLAAARKFPAAYQHLPAPGTTALWDKNAALKPRDLYAGDIAQKLALDDGHLAAAIDFWSKLAFPLRPSAAPRYFAFVGNRQLTLTGYLFDDTQPGAQALTPQEAEDGGDGTIPIWSAGQPELEVQYVGGHHEALFTDAMVRARLLALVPPGPKATAQPAAVTFVEQTRGNIDVVAQHLVLRRRPNRSAHVLISIMNRSVENADGTVVVALKRRPGVDVDAAQWEAEGFNNVREFRVELPAPPPSRRTLQVGSLADFEPGHYRVCFFRTGEKTPAGDCAHFIVQESPTQ